VRGEDIIQLVSYIRHILNFHSKKLSRARCAFHPPRRSSLFSLFSEKIHLLHPSSRARAHYRFVRVWWKRACAKARKNSRPWCGFTFVSHDCRGWWQRRRLKAKRACLANISKTKCKLTRRPFGVYITPRSRGSWGAVARIVRLSRYNNIHALFYRMPFTCFIVTQCFCWKYANNIWLKFSAIFDPNEKL